MVTEFRCGSIGRMLLILALHRRFKRAIRKKTSGLTVTKVATDWRNRRVYNISLWESLASVYTMGRAEEHVRATRMPGRLGITTTCNVYVLEGDWLSVMFGGPERDPPPADR